MVYLASSIVTCALTQWPIVLLESFSRVFFFNYVSVLLYKKYFEDVSREFDEFRANT